MTLEASFQALSMRFEILRDAVSSLRVTVVEDKPKKGDVALVDNLSNSLDDLLACLEASQSAARDAREAVDYPTDLQSARRSLILCQENFNEFSHRLFSDLLAYDRLVELNGFASERGGEWRAWSDTVTEVVGRCWQPAYDVTQALFICWQEITERTGMNSVSLQTTNIGQQISIPEGEKTGSREIKGVP